jgi:hypothetical protein
MKRPPSQYVTLLTKGKQDFCRVPNTNFIGFSVDRRKFVAERKFINIC